MNQAIALHCCGTGVHAACYCGALDGHHGVFMCPVCGRDPEMSYGVDEILESAKREKETVDC